MQTVETSHTTRVVDIPAHRLDAVGRTYLLTFQASGASVGIYLYMEKTMRLNNAQRRSHRADRIAEAPAGEKSTDQNQ